MSKKDERELLKLTRDAIKTTKDATRALDEHKNFLQSLIDKIKAQIESIQSYEDTTTKKDK